MAKKLTSSKVCLTCGERLQRAQAKYAKQYCDDHKRMMDQLRKMRQPCRKVGCKNPAHEDGFCDGCRPFAKDHVPMREDWLRGEGLIKTNSPKCPYYGTKTESGTYRSKAATDVIVEIRTFLND